MTLEERFWSKVNKDGPVPIHAPDLGPCWVWTGHLTLGYGYFRVDSTSAGKVRAHRFAFFLKHGVYPLNGLHKCDNKACVNWDHLYDGTLKDNARDAKERGQLTRPKNPAGGMRNGNSKLTDVEVQFIRENPVLSAVAIAKELGVTKKTVYNIRNGAFWRTTTIA